MIRTSYKVHPGEAALIPLCSAKSQCFPLLSEIPQGQTSLPTPSVLPRGRPPEIPTFFLILQGPSGFPFIPTAHARFHGHPTLICRLQKALVYALYEYIALYEMELCWHWYIGTILIFIYFSTGDSLIFIVKKCKKSELSELSMTRYTEINAGLVATATSATCNL